MSSDVLTRYSRAALIVVAIAGTGLLTWISFQVLFPWWVANTAFDRVVNEFVEAGHNPLLIRGVTVLAIIPFFWAVTSVVRIGMWQRLSGKGGPALRRRRIAMMVIGCYFAGYFFLLYAASRDTYFGATSGTAMKYYAITPEGVRFFDTPGTDPKYGIALRPVDSTTMVNLKRAELGQAPTRIILPLVDSTQFFDPITGDPRIWYHDEPTGDIELFTAPGVHPAYGVALRPVTPDVVRRLRQNAADVEAIESAAAAESARKATETKEAAERAQREQQIARLVNRDAAGRGPAVMAVSADGQLMGDLATRIASAIGGSSSLFRPAFASGGTFARAFEGDTQLLRPLVGGRNIASIVLVKADTEIGPAGVLDNDLMRARVQLEARVVVPTDGYSSHVVTARGIGASFDKSEAVMKALAAAEKELVARLRQ
jgi:hypothetical protein